MVRDPELPERDRRILGAVVRAYIEQAEPVSSLWLASRGFGVSSATLRNIMAKLEDLGYVRQPHTSAGRVPTDLGYRVYVNELLLERRSARAAPHVEARLRRSATVEDLLANASQEVSRASHQVGFAIAPAAESAYLERVDFVPLDGQRILVILVAAGGHVSQRVIEPDEEFGPLELQQAANYLNREFRGRTLLEIRREVLERLQEERTLYDALAARTLRLASSTFSDIATTGPAMYVQGTSLLLEDLAGEDPEAMLEALRVLLRIIEEKTRLLQLLDDYLNGAGLTIVIGSEHHAPDLQRFSIVVSTYAAGSTTGAVGVIGPTRMRYSKAINAVDSLSKTMSRMADPRS
jgi:heat-inducible transcriptional repressor